jgi:hypothetical protein
MTEQPRILQRLGLNRPRQQAQIKSFKRIIRGQRLWLSVKPAAVRRVGVFGQCVVGSFYLIATCGSLFVVLHRGCSLPLLADMSATLLLHLLLKPQQVQRAIKKGPRLRP